MAHSKSMGIGSMFVLLVVAVVLLPMIVRYIDKNEPHFSISGFQDIAKKYAHDDSVEGVPAIGSSSKLPSWRPDKNTDYLCRSPNDSGTPCDTGSFCYGPTQSCVPISVEASNEVVGYYS